MNNMPESLVDRFDDDFMGQLLGGREDPAGVVAQDLKSSIERLAKCRRSLDTATANPNGRELSDEQKADILHHLWNTMTNMCHVLDVASYLFVQLYPGCAPVHNPNTMARKKVFCFYDLDLDKVQAVAAAPSDPNRELPDSFQMMLSNLKYPSSMIDPNTQERKAILFQSIWNTFKHRTFGLGSITLSALRRGGVKATLRNGLLHDDIDLISNIIMPLAAAADQIGQKVAGVCHAITSQRMAAYNQSNADVYARLSGESP